MTIETTDDRLTVDDVRTFVPAREFARSKAFYEAIGWATIWTDGTGLALMELGGYRFMLQDYYVKDWAENFMLTIVVADAGAWFERVSAALQDGDFGDARVAEPRVEDWGATVTYVWDPCGVLLHFTQFHAA
ncbi:MAG: hypothetical protein ABW219_10400 [Ilumatobacteraceae bacterium]